MRRLFWFFLCLLALGAGAAWAQDVVGPLGLPPLELPDIRIEPVKGSKLPPNLQVSFFIISLSLIPYIVICTTSYIRTTIMLSYLKSALGSTQALSNQLLMGITMMLTLYIMYPVADRINQTALQPYLAGTIEQAEFGVKLVQPVREFMLANTRVQDLMLFAGLSGMRKKPNSPNELSFSVILPSFIMSEVKTGFMIGFLIYLPFLIVDMLVAATLMSMGMFMISPQTISMPFKLMLFVTLDGWHVLITGLVKSFNRPEWMTPPSI